MPNMRLIREGLEAADDLADLLADLLVGKRGEVFEKRFREKRRRIHVALREAVQGEKDTIKNRRDHGRDTE